MTKISALTALTTIAGTEEFAVNDAGTSKKVAASLLGSSDGWTKNTTTLTRTGNHTFTESGNTATKWQPGTRFEYTQSSVVEWGVVQSSSHSAGTTTVTLVTNADYAMAAGSLDNPRYSYQESPPGYPGWFNYTCGWSASVGTPSLGNGTLLTRFAISGKVVNVIANFAAGSTTTFGTAGNLWAFTLPTGIAHSSAGVGYGENAGVTAHPCIVRVESIFYLYSNSNQNFGATHPFTWAVGDFFNVAMTYEIA